MAKRYYVTTPIHSVNAVPHVGHALTSLVWPRSYDVKDVGRMLFALRRFVDRIPSAVKR